MGFGVMELSGQAAVEKGARFDVATIKPSASDSHGSNLNLNIGRFEGKNVTLKVLIQFAYHLNSGSDDQIVGAPAWVQSVAFDVSAKEDDALAARVEKMSPDERTEALRLMLRALLVDRFRLKTHDETRVLPVIALTAAKRGPMLKSPQGEDKAATGNSARWGGLHNDGHGQIEGRAATMEMLVNVLASQPEIGGRMVVNLTGLTGKYDFVLRWTPDAASSTAGSPEGEGSGPSLFAALQEQLGLKLEARKAPVMVLVIDSVDRPSEN